MRTQHRDEKFESKRPLQCLFRCLGCNFKWRSQSYTCSKCDYGMVHIKDFLSGQRIGYGASVHIPHGGPCACPDTVPEGTCECPVCLTILRKAATCSHDLEKIATGPTSCPKCQHNYVEWLNYTPSKYFWVDHLLGTQGKP